MLIKRHTTKKKQKTFHIELFYIANEKKMIGSFQVRGIWVKLSIDLT